MNFVDIIIIAAMIWAAFSGWKSGAVAQCVSLVGIFLSFRLALAYGEKLGAWLGMSGGVASVGGFIAMFVVVSIAISVAAFMLKKIVRLSLLGSVDVVGGVALSLIKMALLLGVVFSAVGMLSSKCGLPKSKHIEASVLYKPISTIADVAFPHIKELGKEIKTRVDKIA